MLNLALALLLPVTSDLHVDAAANCALADGSQGAPYCAINDALGVAVDGDVILIAPGTYPERLVIDVDVQLIGVEGSAVTTLDGELTRSLVETATDTDVEFDGLTLTRARGDAATVIVGGDFTLSRSTISECCPAPVLGFGTIFGIPGSGSLTVQDSLFSLNGLGCPGQLNGGILWTQSNGPITIERTTFDRNRNGIAAIDVDVTIRDSTFSDIFARSVDSAGYETIGFAATVGRGLLTVSNSTFTGGLSGAVATWGSPGVKLEMKDCTVTDCIADANSGGAVSALGSTSGTIENSIIAGNSTRSLPFQDLAPGDIAGTIVSRGHNVVGVNGTGGAMLVDGLNGDQVGTLAAPLEPLLAALADNGGPTPTRAPLSSSPARGAGGPVDTYFFDQRGIVRPSAFNDVGSFQTTVSVPAGACAAEPNSTGDVGVISVSGSALIQENVVTLGMSHLPPASTAFFIVSRTQGFVAGAGGSDGNLCLGGQIGRYVGPGQVSHSGALGQIVLDVDLQAIPQPGGFASTTSGETWYMQGWHRDVSSTGLTSNFTGAVEVAWW